MVKEKDSTLSPTFIVKPDGGSQGDGIYLIRDPGELKATVGSQARQGVVQEYIHRPLLIDKLKFDIRLYVLMKSLEPLEIYIAKEGLTRFCTEPYQVGSPIQSRSLYGEAPVITTASLSFVTIGTEPEESEPRVHAPDQLFSECPQWQLCPLRKPEHWQQAHAVQRPLQAGVQGRGHQEDLVRHHRPRHQNPHRCGAGAQSALSR